MGLFEQLSWFSCLVTGGMILYFLWVFPRLIVKPSFMCVLALHVLNQWSSAFHAVEIEQILPRPWEYFVMVQVFPPTALVLSLFFFHTKAYSVLKKIRLHQKTETYFPTQTCAFLLVLVMAVMAWYLSVVPFSSTGLYALFMNADHSSLIREQTMKLLPSLGLKYALALISAGVIPLLSVMLAIDGYRAFKQFHLFKASVYLVGILFCLGCVSIYGARAPSAMILLAIFFAFSIRSQSLMNPIKAFIYMLTIFTIPAFFSLLRDGEGISLSGMGFHYLNVLDRAFGRSIVDGIWHVDYVQRHGFWGLDAIGNLANVFGMDGINSFNAVGRLYSPGSLESVSSNTSFTIAYYSCFGLPAFLLCLTLVCLLDWIFIFYSDIKPQFLLPCVASCQIAILHLPSTLFTTLLITHGFLPG